jgi:hypothetical protein
MGENSLTGFDAANAQRVYDETGWYVSDSIIDTGLLMRARETVSSLGSRERDRTLPDGLSEFFRLPAGAPRPLRFNQYIALQYQTIAELAQLSVLGEIAGALARTREVRIFNTALVKKEPGLGDPYTVVGWHCDHAFWPTCSSARMLTAWIPLQDTTAEAGTLRVLTGSHRWLGDGRIPRLVSGKAFIGDNEAEVQSQLRLAGLAYEPVPIELRAGQVSFHHMLTLHGSGRNRSHDTRYAISVHLQDAENRYRPAFDQDGARISYVHDSVVRRLSNGDPDYADPQICPIIWPRP